METVDCGLLPPDTFKYIISGTGSVSWLDHVLATLGASQCILSIEVLDTFVSSDTPLESPHFAFVPLGSGPVLRSIENASMATPSEFDRNRGIAEAAGIEAQIGLTQGSTDGTTFTIYGAPNAGLSWPGRYSHSPAEIADLRDVAELIDLIQAMAEAPQGF